MAKKSSWNPIAFVPTQVTLISTAVYIALFTILIWVNNTVPSAPKSSTPVDGVNLTQTWLDLSRITDGYHPIDSRKNGEVKAYLLQRIEEILEHNDVDYKVIETNPNRTNGASKEKDVGPKPVTVFIDELSNTTFVDDFRKLPWTCYGESENLMVYIRGEDDEENDWWNSDQNYEGQAGVLVNAHYDSVASGFGATDDGVGVVTLLQLISHFTAGDNRPKRGLVALFNNGEENGLYGAHSYLRHPLSQFTHTFLNLEGAGAGGRALLFRSTDAEVTKFYSRSPHPFGNVVTADGFKRGFVRSGTDYSVFNNDNGMRGLDVAFFQPRARYHTDQDDTRDTNQDSVWHMLSAALSTTRAMTSHGGDEFNGRVDDDGKLDIGKGTNGVWFDLFGRAFPVLELPTLFAISIALLVAPPLVLLILEITLRRSDKWYPLSKRQYIHSSDDDEAVHFSGLRGLFRFPIAFIASAAAVLALAYLLTKINPHIFYSSEYAVWAMMLSVWFAVAWFFLAGADRVRPTALQRMYNLIWLYALTWVLLVGATVGETQLQLASGYFIVIYNASAFVTLLISYLELFALPTRASFVEHVADAEEEIERRSVRPSSSSSRQVLGRSDESRSRRGNEEDDANERTSLLRGSISRGGGTFTGGGNRRHPDNDGTLSEIDDPYLTKAYGDEQAWSSSLPQWTWILQFLILAPINIVIVGQISLLVTGALNQTTADGSSPFAIYIFVAVLTMLLLLPLTPFLHRFAYQVPSLLFLVFIGCLIYNLLAFPFSRDSRLKVFFVQQVDLNNGVNHVKLSGLDGFVQRIVEELPSAIGQSVECNSKRADNSRPELTTCEWSGLEPNVLADQTALKSSAVESGHQNSSTWLDYNMTHHKDSASFSIRGRNTKHCHLEFDNAVSDIHIDDTVPDPRYRSVHEKGSSQVRLFSRTWDKTFKVNVTWSDEKAKGQTGKVWCLWSDANQIGTIPAYDELRRFQPFWSAATKASDGLVEGYKEFEI